MNWLLNRLKERSTWLAIFTLAGLVGIKLEPEFREAIINVILAVAAVVAFVFRENTHERSTGLPAIETRSKRVSNLTEEDSVLIGVHSYNELIDKGMRVGESNETDHQPPRQETPLPSVPGHWPIELVGKSESADATQPEPSHGADHSISHARRVTDAWLHDPVPSEAGFKRQGVANHEPVGWNDDY